MNGHAEKLKVIDNNLQGANITLGDKQLALAKVQQQYDSLEKHSSKLSAIAKHLTVTDPSKDRGISLPGSLRAKNSRE